MIPNAELNMQRNLTVMFIEADPLEIQLLRPTWGSDGAGGRIRTGTANVGGLQRMRLIPLGDGAAERLTADGKEVSPNYMLMGLFSADMQRWDEFTIDSRRYQIVFINQNKQYEIKGEVAYLG
jgi:hypothetical protein